MEYDLALKVPRVPLRLLFFNSQKKSWGSLVKSDKCPCSGSYSQPVLLYTCPVRAECSFLMGNERWLKFCRQLESMLSSHGKKRHFSLARTSQHQLTLISVPRPNPDSWSEQVYKNYTYSLPYLGRKAYKKLLLYLIALHRAQPAHHPQSWRIPWGVNAWIKEWTDVLVLQTIHSWSRTGYDCRQNQLLKQLFNFLYPRWDFQGFANILNVICQLAGSRRVGQL